MTKPSKDKSGSTTSEVKKRGRKKLDGPKGLGLFDHVKHIRSVQNPDYYKNLSDLDRKSFNPFMILKALSMNPSLLEDISTLFKYFDKVPHPQFYQLLIGLIPQDKRFYPWVKATKKRQYTDKLLGLIVKYFEVSEKEAVEYASLLSSSTNGKKELRNLCVDFGLEDKEVELALKGNDDEE